MKWAEAPAANGLMETYSWQARTEDGEKVIYEAEYFGGWWKLTCMPKVGRARQDEVEPEQVEFTEETWRALRDLLWRKYQRRRVAWSLVQHIDDILAGKAKNERRDRR